MKTTLYALLLAQSAGCVIRYGEGAAAAAAADAAPDFSEVDDRLAGLQAEAPNVDTRDRLVAAADLAAAVRAPAREGFPPESQEAVLDYLYTLLEIEERAAADAVPSLIGAVGVIEVEPEGGGALAPPPAIEEEELGEDLPALDEPALDEPALEEARESLARGHYASAIRAIEPLREAAAGGAQGDDVEALWSEAVDGFVHAERERASVLFLEARDVEDDGARASAMEEVLDLLEGLVEDYPESAYTSALKRNIELVKRAVEEASGGGG